MYTSKLDVAEFCLGFGSETDPCRQDCEEAGEEYFHSFNLTDVLPNSVSKLSKILFKALHVRACYRKQHLLEFLI